MRDCATGKIKKHQNYRCRRADMTEEEWDNKQLCIGTLAQLRERTAKRYIVWRDDLPEQEVNRLKSFCKNNNANEGDMRRASKCKESFKSMGWYIRPFDMSREEWEVKVREIKERRKFKRIRKTSSKVTKEPRKIITSSEYRGVCWNKQAQKWLASIHDRPNQYCLGSHTDELKAALAYDLAAIKFHGDFAKPNFTLEERQNLIEKYGTDLSPARRVKEVEYIGVGLEKNCTIKKYKARVGGVYLGGFATAEDAALAYDDKAKELNQLKTSRFYKLNFE